MSRARQTLRDVLQPLVFGAVAVAVWQAAAAAHLVNTFWFSSPSKVGGTFYAWLVSGKLPYHAAITLEEVVLGFTIGTAIAFLAAFVLNESPFLLEVLDPIIVSVYGLPKIALAPLFVVWFGIGIPFKVVITAFIVFFVVFYQVLSGLRNVDRGLIDAVRIMGARRIDLYTKVYLPASRGWLLYALRLGFPLAFQGAILGEIIAANRGLGYLTVASTGNFDTSGAFAALLAMLCITVPVHFALGKIVPAHGGEAETAEDVGVVS